MKLTQKDIQEFKQIMSDEFQINLSDTQAEEQAKAILNFLSTYLL